MQCGGKINTFAQRKCKKTDEKMRIKVMRSQIPV